MHGRQPQRNRLGLLLAALALLICQAATADHTAAPAPTDETIDGVTVVDADALIELAQQLQELRIIDARIPSDRRFGYIEGSINLPDVETDCDSLAHIVPDRQTPTLFYCNGPKCGRSERAVRIARDCGYQRLFWYRGGIAAWIREGFPVFRD